MGDFITILETVSFSFKLLTIISDSSYAYVFIADFKSYFEKFGKVVTGEVMFNRETHKSRGFGFIVFELEKSAENVCAQKEHIIDGKVVSKLERIV